MTAAEFLPLALALAMFGLGLKLHPGAIVALMRRPAAFLLCLAGPLVVAPGMALGLVVALGLAPSDRLALTVIAGCPIGALAGVLAAYGRASLAPVMAATIISTGLAGISFPAVFALAALSESLPSLQGFGAVGGLGLKVAAFTSAPLAAGLVLRGLLGPRAVRLGDLAKNLGAFGIVACFGAIIAGLGRRLFELEPTLALAIVAFNVLMVGVSLGLGELLGQAADRRALPFAYGVRQEETGLFVAVSVLAEPALVTPLLFNAVTALLLGFTVLLFCRRSIREPAAPPPESA